MIQAALVWSLLSCSGPDPKPPGRPDRPEDTGTPPPPPFASCATWETNPLRVWCDAALEEPGALRVELVRPDGAVRTFRSEAATSHHVLGWGLKPGTPYTWRVVDERTGEQAEGLLQTGPIPPDLEILTLNVTATGDPSIDAVLISPNCPTGYIDLVDRDGDVIWYQEVAQIEGEDSASFVNTMTYTEDDTILMSLTKNSVLEIDWSGALRMRSRRDVDFPNRVHHELFKRDGVVYALYAESAEIDGVDYVVDGVYAIDGAGRIVDEVSLVDLYPRSIEDWMLGGYWGGFFPDHVDFTHTNSIHVDEGGDLWLSFRHLHAFARLRGGPGTEGFGTLLWTAVGDPLSPIASAEGLARIEVLGQGFLGQHDVQPHPDGTVTLLDNGWPVGRPTRGVRYALDEAAGTLTELGSWPTDLACPVQGSVRDLSSGTVALTCASMGIVREYAEGEAEPRWQLRTTCRELLAAVVARGIPISLD